MLSSHVTLTRGRYLTASITSQRTEDPAQSESSLHKHTVSYFVGTIESFHPGRPFAVMRVPETRKAI
jgi:hypothetical protein